MKLADNDLQWIARRVPSPVVRLLSEAASPAVIAGGFIRAMIAGETVSDVDIWVPSKDVAKELATKLSHPDFSQAATKLLETDNAYSVLGLEWPVQFVHRWTFDSPEATLAHFDFTIAKAAIWRAGGKWQGECDERFYADLAAKRLTYCTETPADGAGGSLLRMLKFYRRGYRAPLDTIAELVERVKTQAGTGSVFAVLVEIDPAANPDNFPYSP